MINIKQQDSKENKTQQPTQGVGALLRASRSRLGEDLRSVAQNLRIRHVYLEAIEESRFANLPGTTYAVGFVRAYSEYLGLDGHEVVRRFKEEYSEVEKRPDLIFPVPVPERSLPTGAILLVSAVLALAAYGGWYVLSSDTDQAEQVPSLPQRLQSLLPGQDKAEEAKPAEAEKVVEVAKEAAPAATENAEKAAEKVEEKVEVAVEEAVEEVKEEVAETAEKAKEAVAEKTEPVAEKVEEKVEDTKTEIVAAAEEVSEPVVAKKPEPVNEPQAETPTVEKTEPEKTEPTPDANLPEEASEPASSEPAEEKADETASATEENAQGEAEEASSPVVNDGPSRIELRASEESWIQVRDEIANTMLVTRLLRPGDSYKVPNRKGLSLMTGNAGVLEVVVDGNSTPSLGAIGTVLRRVLLDADKLVAGTAISE